MAGGVGHTGGLKNPAPGAEDAEPVFLRPMGLPCFERGHLLQERSTNCYNGYSNTFFLLFFLFLLVLLPDHRELHRRHGLRAERPAKVGIRDPVHVPRAQRPAQDRRGRPPASQGDRHQLPHVLRGGGPTPEALLEAEENHAGHGHAAVGGVQGEARLRHG